MSYRFTDDQFHSAARVVFRIDAVYQGRQPLVHVNADDATISDIIGRYSSRPVPPTVATFHSCLASFTDSDG